MATAWAEAWIAEARTRMAAGDMEGAARAATFANDADGPCPFTEPALVLGWQAAAAARARARTSAPAPASWRPRAGSTQAAHSAEHIRDFDL